MVILSMVFLGLKNKYLALLEETIKIISRISESISLLYEK